MKENSDETRNESFKSSATQFVKSGLEAVLSKSGFHIVDFSFQKILRDTDFRHMVQESYPNTDVGRILLEAPDLFVMHKKMEPVTGVFFIKLITLSRGARPKSIRLSADAHKTFARFYPSDKILIIVIRGDDISPLIVGWFDKSSLMGIDKLKPFEIFLKAELGIEADRELCATLNKELIKMYRPE